MGTIATDAVRELRRAFEPFANPEQAFDMAAYMRDQFVYLGLKSPVRKHAQKPIEKAIAKESVETILAFSHECWRQQEREFKYTACELLRRTAKRFEPEHIDDVKTLITTESWWDTVDALAARTVGPIVQRHELGAVMDEWIEDDDLWVARTALIHQLFWKADTDEVRLFAYCERQLAHPDFFIRKAIGWALRQHAYVDADAVLAFVEQHEHEMSPLSKREALKHIG